MGPVGPGPLDKRFLGPLDKRALHLERGPRQPGGPRAPKDVKMALTVLNANTVHSNLLSNFMNGYAIMHARCDLWSD